MDRETAIFLREEAAMVKEPLLQSTLPSKFLSEEAAMGKEHLNQSALPSKFLLQVSADSKEPLLQSALPSKFLLQVSADSKSQSPGLQRNDSKRLSVLETMSGSCLPSNSKFKLDSAREEATCGNDIQREYFVDRRIPSVVSIFRVPNFLKHSKNQKLAYVPQAVSLGSYHSKRANLSGMDDHKKRALLRMMTRFNIEHDGNNPHDRESYSSEIGKIIQDHEEEIWNTYEEKLVYKPFDLALDGCFILEILRTLGGQALIWEGISNYYEPIFERRKIQFTGFDILNDILKLENQIPLIVLLKLLELEFNSVDTAKKYLLDVLVKTPVTKFYPFDYEDDMEKWSWPQPVEQVHHFLGLLYKLIVSPSGDQCAIQIDDGKQKSGKDDRCIPTAVELSNVGIKFQRCNGGIKKIHFDPSKATIYLPPINVTDHTEVLFRNIIALELCNASEENYLTSYLSLMNNLIDTEKDVAVLRRSDIVKNYHASEAEVAELFNGLCKGVSLPPEHVFKQLQYDVMKHYTSKFKVWFAQFIKDYFSSPWKFLALLGAILALVLTLVQTIFSIIE